MTPVHPDPFTIFSERSLVSLQRLRASLVREARSLKDRAQDPMADDSPAKDPAASQPGWASASRHERPIRLPIMWPTLTKEGTLPRWRQGTLFVSTTVVLISMLFSLALPAIGLLAAYGEYTQLRSMADSALHHLLAAKDDLVGTAATPKAGASGASSVKVDPASVRAALGEMKAAQKDFAKLHTKLGSASWILATAGSMPGIASKLESARGLANVGYDVTMMGVEVLSALQPVLSHVGGSSASLGDAELLQPQDLAAFKQAVAHADGYVADIQVNLARVSLADLPLSAKQKGELAHAMVELPRIRAALSLGSTLVDPIGWLLGVGEQRNYLVQTLDRSELRPSGGFQGNYGVLSIKNAKMAKFSLYNVNDIDYGLRTNGWIFGRRAPAAYSWWPFANWGLRDANLSSDFPTSANLIMDVFAHEGGGTVDGVIQISPVAIQHLLKVTGPIFVPNYNETITAENLEDRIHFYQQDPAGIAIEARLNPGDHTHSLRKRFTQLVVQLVQDKVKTLPFSQMGPLAKQLLGDLQSKDIQLYFKNQDVQTLLAELQGTGAINQTPGVDGFFISQANVSVAKLTPYVAMTQTDTITLDDKGGATHHVVVTWHNNPTGPIYGYPTYRDYVRFYVPAAAQLKYADGFDTGVPMCWSLGLGVGGPTGADPLPQFAELPPCGAWSYPGRELVCPRGAYGVGAMAGSVQGVGDGKSSWANSRPGRPTATTSDVPGRAMFGGYVLVPRSCTATVTLDYYVPGVVAPVAANVPKVAGPYSLVIDRQGGTFYPMSITINPSPKMASAGAKPMHYEVTIDTTRAITYGKPGAVTVAQLLGMGRLGGLLGA